MMGDMGLTRRFTPEVKKRQPGTLALSFGATLLGRLLLCHRVHLIVAVTLWLLVKALGCGCPTPACHTFMLQVPALQQALPMQHIDNGLPMDVDDVDGTHEVG